MTAAIDGAFAATACTFLAIAVWIRRWTVFPSAAHLKLTERPFTICLLLQLAWLFLISPLSGPTLGRLLHTTFGLWGIDAWVGQYCYAGSITMFAIYLANRFAFSDEQLRAWFKQRFERLLTIIGPILLALLGMSRNAIRPDIFIAKPDHWMLRTGPCWASC